MRSAEAIFVFAIKPEVEAVFDEKLEVSLDCSHCQRTRRTVDFKLGKPHATCWPGSAGGMEEHPPYPGRLLELDVERGPEGIRAAYRIEYEVSPFVDARYGVERPWTGHPIWGRAQCTLKCPRCSETKNSVIQNNCMRPLGERCSCGYVFFVEHREMPLLRWPDPETGDWKQAEERFGAPNEDQ